MNFFERLFVQIQTFKSDKTLCDVTIVVANKKFPIHKIVLAAASDYFKHLFTSDMMEKLEKEIEIKQISPVAFDDCLNYMYYGTWEFNIVGIKDLLHAANLFLLSDMKEICALKIKDNTSIENCLDLYQSSRLFDNKSLELSVRDFVNENAEQLLTNESFIREVDEDTLEMMFTSEDINISDESCLFDMLVKWVAVSEDRREQFCELLPLIRLVKIEKEHFTNFVGTNAHLRSDCMKCNSYLWQAINHLIDNKKHNLSDAQRHNRQFIEESNLDIHVLSYSVEEGFSKFEYGELIQPVLNFKQNPDIDFNLHAIAYSGGKFYIIGEDTTSRVFCCDPTITDETKKWQEIPQMPNQHNDDVYRSRLVCYYDKILAVGGKISKKGVKVVDCLDITSLKWSEFQPLNIGRANACCIKHGDKVYAIGGWDRQNLSSAEVYNPQENEWNMLPTMNRTRQNAAAEFYNFKIFVSGGFISKDNFEKSVETFREGDSAWTLIANTNVGRHLHGMFVHNEKLHVFGGVRMHGDSLFERWDKTEEKWEESIAVNDEVLTCKIFKF